jgi:hypothetical protein
VKPLFRPPRQDQQIDIAVRADSSWLRVTRLDGLAPFDAGTAPGIEDTIPPDLQRVLFADDGLSTYAVLDAAACPLLPELLEQSGGPHLCLFTGESEENLSDAAPWLVKLTPQARITRALCSTSGLPGGLWDRELGIFIRTTLGLQDLWSHCRRFTRIKDEQGQWIYNRFWAPTVSTRIMALGNRPELVPFVSPFFPDTAHPFEVILLDHDLHARLSRLAGTTALTNRPVLTQAVQQTFRDVRRIQQYDELIEIALPHVRGKVPQPDDAIRVTLLGHRDYLFSLGFWQRDHLTKLMVWEVLLGPNFLVSYAAGQVAAILRNASAPYEAIAEIEALLARQEEERKSALAAPVQADGRNAPWVQG